MQIILEISLGFSLVVGFLLVSLRMTKSIGGEAASWATKAVGFTAGVATGALTGVAAAPRLAKLAGAIGIPTAGAGAGAAAGRVAGVPLRPFREAAFARGRAAAGEAAKKVVEEGAKPGIVGGALRGLGIAGVAGRAEAGVRANIKENIEKSEKDYEKLNETALKTEYGYVTTTPEKRAAIIKVLGKRGKLKLDEKGERLIDPDSIKTTLETVKARGYDTEKEVVDKYLWQYATTDDERGKEISKLSPEDIKKLSEEYFDPKMMAVMLKNLKPAQMTAILEINPMKKKDKDGNPVKDKDGKDVYEEAYGIKFFNALRDLMSEIKKTKPEITIEKYLESVEIKNMSLAQMFRGKAGRNIADSYNIPHEAQKKKKDGKDNEEDEDEEEETLVGTKPTEEKKGEVEPETATEVGTETPPKGEQQKEEQ